MSTSIRPEISKRNDYYISKHRYYELKHFCLQYPEWKTKLAEIGAVRASNLNSGGTKVQIEYKNPVLEDVLYYESVEKKVRLVEECALRSDIEISKYVLKAVTVPRSYEILRSVDLMPCSKNRFYRAYRRFFWHLDHLKE